MQQNEVPSIQAQGLPLAQTTDAMRTGEWHGGAEPVSGKLRSGIVSYYQLEPKQAVAGQALEISIRLEEVVGNDAKLEIQLEKIQKQSGSDEQSSWSLPMGKPSLIKMTLIPTAGDNYVHLMTSQNGKSSVRSIRISTGDANPKTQLHKGQTYEVDAKGEPIIRMQNQ